MLEKIKHLGILCGAGSLPLIAARSAHDQNISVSLFPVIEETINSDLEKEFLNRVFPVSIGGLGHFLKLLQDQKITHLLLLGKVRKEHLFKPDMKFDSETLQLLSELDSRNDDAFFFALSKKFESMGITVISQETFLGNIKLAAKQYTGNALTEQELQDIRFGMYHASKIGELDIGQTVVVHNRAVLAVEAIEGTDLCLQRAGAVTHKKGGIVCKSQKKNQDTRFDVPTVGLHTIQVMQENGLHILAIEAEKTFVVTPEEVITAADKAGITLIAAEVPVTPFL
ncbi:MAG: UDP-2,3-diacylglucosamine diphosphatase LpxI [Leptospiraceae bacterium]|nr:UDP-2,3-diacylglucosamine diphosphatase LpxI [Leptospiraceae bacterium]